MKSDFCNIVDGMVVAAKVSALRYGEVDSFSGGWTIPCYLPREELAALLPLLAVERTKLEQKRLDDRNATWDAADAGDAAAKRWTVFMKRPTTRTVEPCKPQCIEVHDYQWRDGKALSTCRYCGEQMLRINHRHRHTYCSNTCADMARESAALARPKPNYYTPREAPPPRHCAHCGTLFSPRRADAKTCSQKCRTALSRRR